MPADVKPDSTIQPDSFRVAVLIATRGRRELLEMRSLPSISKQTRRPDYLVLIEDTTDPRRPSTRRVLHRRAFPGTKFLAARNARSPGVSGAWNTGLQRLATIVDDPSRTFVAILDDDDAYAPDHLASCLERAIEDDLDLVAAGMWRHERPGEEPIEQHPPEKMEAAEFLVRSQHLQGSNLFVRLSILLEAGNFDEGQTSTTDRDVCVRLADLPKLRYARLGQATVHHYAEPDRDRMSTPRSITRCRGLTEFHVKWRSRMSPTQEKSSRGRARELFAWIDPPPPFDLRLDASSIAVTATVRDAGIRRLVVASVVSEAGAESARRFVEQVARVAPAPTEAIWLVDDRGLASAHTSRAAASGLAIRCAEATAVRESLGLSENSPRATPHVLLSSLVGAYAREPGDAVWFVRDDFAPHARAATKDGEIDVPLDFAGAIARARDADSTMIAGPITGDPLEIPEFGLRVELVDALHHLYWLGKSEPDAPIADRGAENAIVRRGRVAWANDASLLDSDRIERPVWLVPERGDETAREAFARLARSLPGILEGRRVFRRGLLDATSFDEAADVPSLANLLVLDVAALLDAPLLASTIAEARDPREFAAFRALSSAAGRYVAGGGVAVHRVARMTTPAPDPIRWSNAIVADAVGASFSFAALTTRSERVGGEIEVDDRFRRAFERAFARNLRERERRVVIGFHRCRGLARSTLRRSRPQGSPWAWWWEKGGERGAIQAVRDFARDMRDRFAPELLTTFRRELNEAASRVDASTASGLVDAARDHRAAMRDADVLARLVRASTRL